MSELLLANWLAFAKDVLTIVGGFAAAVWFFHRRQHGRRAQLDLDCEFFPVENSDTVVAEIRFRVENKGSVKQDLYGFEVSVSSLTMSGILQGGTGSGDLRFDKVLVGRRQIDVPDADVRPGIQRLFTYPVILQSPGPLIQISAALRYSSSKDPINEVKKIFRVAGADASPAVVK